jgi:hypothetical protein
MREARRGLDRVAAAERTYIDGHPFRLVHQYDPRGGVYTVRVEVERAIPAEVPALAMHVLHDASAALDALASALASPEGSAAPAVRFPIHDSLPQFAQRSRRPLAGMPDEAQATIEALQPYHTFGGYRNDPLWLLRELRASEPLRLAAGALQGDTAFGVNTKRHVEIMGDLHVVPGAFDAGAVIASVAARVAGPDPKLDLFLRPRLVLALAADGPARGAGLLETLGTICDHVEQVVIAPLEPWIRRG